MLARFLGNQRVSVIKTRINDPGCFDDNAWASDIILIFGLKASIFLSKERSPNSLRFRCTSGPTNRLMYPAESSSISEFAIMYPIFVIFCTCSLQIPQIHVSHLFSTQTENQYILWQIFSQKLLKLVLSRKGEKTIFLWLKWNLLVLTAVHKMAKISSNKFHWSTNSA